jgi:hypothetical protein
MKHPGTHEFVGFEGRTVDNDVSIEP